jgi:hypothetical protein
MSQSIGGSRRPGAIPRRENRDRDIAIHLTIKFYNFLRLGITIARAPLEELTKHGKLNTANSRQGRFKEQSEPSPP